MQYVQFAVRHALSALSLSDWTLTCCKSLLRVCAQTAKMRNDSIASRIAHKERRRLQKNQNKSGTLEGTLFYELNLSEFNQKNC